MADETTPLIDNETESDPHTHFCLLVGISPDDNDKNTPKVSNSKTLYNRARKKRKAQHLTYNFTAALSNTLLLTQVVLGATLTALGASDSSHVLITIFGVINTIIAGIIAYLKSRGQPMRARMFRDDLEHVVDEIENSKTMWLGIKHHVHGYDEVDVDDKVSVRSEVARLTRLYESAVQKYVQNNPDLYSASGGVLDPVTGLRSRPGAAATQPSAGNSANTPSAPAADVSPAADDESPATAKEFGAKKNSATVESDNKGKPQGKSGDEGSDVTKPKENGTASAKPVDESPAAGQSDNNVKGEGGEEAPAKADGDAVQPTTDGSEATADKKASEETKDQ